MFLFEEKDFPFDDSSPSSGSEYYISVTYDEQGKPIVRAKTHGYVGVNELGKDLEEECPGARIDGLKEKPLVRIVGEKEVKENKPKKSKKPKEEEKNLVFTS